MHCNRGGNCVSALYPKKRPPGSLIWRIHTSRAMKFVWERMKLVIEPSSAVPLAVVLYSSEFRQAAERWAAEKKSGLNIGIVISGGNVNMKTALDIISSVAGE
jgi:threonine dehydratase